MWWYMIYEDDDDDDHRFAKSLLRSNPNSSKCTSQLPQLGGLGGDRCCLTQPKSDWKSGIANLWEAPPNSRLSMTIHDFPNLPYPILKTPKSLKVQSRHNESPLRRSPPGIAWPGDSNAWDLPCNQPSWGWQSQPPPPPSPLMWLRRASSDQQRKVAINAMQWKTCNESNENIWKPKKHQKTSIS